MQVPSPGSQAILVNGFLYISRQIPIDAQTQQVMIQNIDAATRQEMCNLYTIFFEIRMDFKNVANPSIFINNIDEVLKINKIILKREVIRLKNL